MYLLNIEFAFVSPILLMNFPAWDISIRYIAHEAEAVSSQHKHVITVIYSVSFCFYKGNEVAL